MHFEISRFMTNNVGSTEIHEYAVKPDRNNPKPIRSHEVYGTRTLLRTLSARLKELRANGIDATHEVVPSQFEPKELRVISTLFVRHNAAVQSDKSK